MAKIIDASEEELASLTEKEREGLLEETDETAVVEPPAGEAAAAEAAKAAAAKEAADEDEPDVAQVSAEEREAAIADALKDASAKPAAKDAAVADGKDEATQLAEEEAARAEAAKAAAAKPGEAAAEPEAEEEERERGSVIPNWTAPKDAAEKLKALDTRRAELAQKFDEADINAKEHLAGLRKIDDEERPIRTAIDRAELSHEMRLTAWNDTIVPDFMDAHPAYKDNDVLASMLDRRVRELQVEAGEVGKNPFSAKILAKAHTSITEATAALLGKKADPADPADGGKPTASAKKPAALDPPLKPRPAAIVTLAHVPAADANDTSEGKFAKLDRLANSDTAGYQAALERMSDADREEYLASA